MELSEAGKAYARDVAERNQVSPDAVKELLRALAVGQGSQAQFNHPDLGGMGQWSRGGMTMIGDMFNNALKAKVDALCAELSTAVSQGDMFAKASPSQSQSQSQSSGAPGVSLFVSGANWWPENLGAPSSTGAQNDMRFGFFPATRRLAVDVGGKVTVYDTGDHAISGASQQQGGDQTLTFTSQHGLVRLADLPVVGAEPKSKAESASKPEPAPEALAVEPVAQERVSPTDQEVDAPSDAAPKPPVKVSAPPTASADDVFAKLERVAELHAKGILSQSEFEAKKAELLDRI